MTGSSGLIGTSVCRSLVTDGYEPVTMDIRPSQYNEFKPRFHDITDRREVKKAVKDIQGVIHLAAVSRVIDAQNAPNLCRHVNVEGTKNILTSLSNHQKQPWIVYGSSREVYGEPKKLPVTENHRLEPINVYGESKVEAEKLISDYCFRENAAAIIFRFSNVYGSVYDHSTRVVPAFVRFALQGKAVRMDCPDHVFDFTHVDDTSDAIMRGVDSLIENKMEGVDSFNVSPGEGTSLTELIMIIGEIIGNNVATFPGEKRSYDVKRYVGDCTKLEAILGYVCKIKIKEGLTTFCNEFREFLHRGK